MANYNIDIGVVIKGNEKLTKFNNALKKTTLQVEQLNKFLKVFQQSGDGLVRSFNTVNSVLVTAKANFNAVASGTKLQEKAARQLIVAEKQLNKEYRQRNTLLQRLRGTGAMNLPGTGVGRDPVASSIERRRRKLMRGANKNSPHSRPIGPGQVSDANIRSPYPPKSDVFLSSVLPPRSPLPPRSSIEAGQSLFGQSVSIEGRSEKIIKERFALRSKLAEMTERDIKAKNKSVNIEERLKKGIQERKDLSAALEKMEKRSVKNLQDQVKQRKQSRKIGQDNLKIKTKEALATKKLAQNEALAAKTARRRRMGSTASSAVIGGAFPLLFGQTGAAAIGGGVGGLAGGAIGGQFGFALSILGTAIGSAVDKVDKFNKSLVELNTRMGTTGSSTAITAKEVNSLAKSLNITKEEVFGVLGAFREFGSGEIAKSMAMIFGSDAGGADRFAGLDRSAKLAQEIFNARKQIGNIAAKDLLIQNQSVDAAVIELALVKAKAKAEQDAAIARVRAVSPFDQFRANTPGMLLLRQAGKMKITDYGEIRAQNLQKKFNEENITLLENYKKGMIEARELLDLLRESQGQFGISGSLQFTAITDKVKDLQDELKKLANPIYMVMTLSDAMATSFEDSFKGIIKGTMSVTDAFRNMLNRIADIFLDTAARMLANQFQQGLLGLIGGIFSPIKAIPEVSQTGPLGNFDFGFAANGGPVTGGKPYIVGERGPELFTPGVSGMITPNHELGGGGLTNVVVNVDASGSSVEGNEDEGRALGIALSAAIETELIKQKRPGGLLA